MSFKLATVKQAQPLVKVTADAVKVAALYADAQIDFSEVSVTEVPKLSPFGILPVLTTPHANVVGAAAIKAVAFGNRCGTLTGRCPMQKIQIDQFFQVVPLIVQQVSDFKALEANKASENDKINALNKLVALVKPINEVLIANTWLLGNNVSIADIYVAFALKEAYARWMGPKKRQELPALTRWFNTVMQQKNVVKVAVEYTVQDKDIWLMPDLTNIAAAKPEVKKEDPIAKLARSPMNLDNIKKLYCAARPFNPNFAEEFFPQFDSEGWELYKVCFKYNKDEWEKLHMCENGVNGFINRAESCKKNSFLVLNVYLVGTFYHVQGAGIVRGNREINGGLEIPHVFGSVSDAEEYEWTHVPMDKKAEFINLFCASKVEGHEVVDHIHLK